MIVALLAGILTPAFLSVRERGRRADCASNLKQLGAALTAYIGDNDEQAPNSRLSLAGLPATKQPPVTLAWAGRLLPYVRTQAAFRCADDSTQAGRDAENRATVPVSYGLNSNLGHAPSLASWIAPARTVWFFETTRDRVRLQDADEGQKSLSPADQMSAIGDGTDGGLLDGMQAAPSQNRTLYATGRMDNAAVSPLVGGVDGYEGVEARHRGGANVMAADGHCRFVLPGQVSAGAIADNPADAQASSGCAALSPAYKLFPCAEGTANGSHLLTFSLH